jgi:hypothetical protein
MKKEKEKKVIVQSSFMTVYVADAHAHAQRFFGGENGDRA